MLTDSGGFQVYSLGEGSKGERLAKVDDEGVTFRSHIDGSLHRLTPEKSIEIQGQLGADIIMALDDVVPANVGGTRARVALERTSRWLGREVDYWQTRLDVSKQALFGIVQGGTDTGLRAESAGAVTSHNLPGYAIGGISALPDGGGGAANFFGGRERRYRYDGLRAAHPPGPPRRGVGVSVKGTQHF